MAFVTSRAQEESLFDSMLQAQQNNMMFTWELIQGTAVYAFAERVQTAARRLAVEFSAAEMPMVRGWIGELEHADLKNPFLFVLAARAYFDSHGAANYWQSLPAEIDVTGVNDDDEKIKKSVKKCEVFGYYLLITKNQNHNKK
jgi:hypothetical protein